MFMVLSYFAQALRYTWVKFVQGFNNYGFNTF